MLEIWMLLDWFIFNWLVWGNFLCKNSHLTSFKWFVVRVSIFNQWYTKRRRKYILWHGFLSKKYRLFISFIFYILVHNENHFKYLIIQNPVKSSFPGMVMISLICMSIFVLIKINGNKWIWIQFISSIQR